MSKISDLAREFSIYNSICGGGDFPKDGYETIKTIPDTIIAEATHGTYEVWTDDDHEVIEPGSFFLLAPMRTIRIAHHHNADGIMRARWVHLKAKRFRHIDIFAIRNLPLKITRSAAPELGQHFDAMQDLLKIERPQIIEGLQYQSHCFGLSAALIELGQWRNKDERQRSTSDLAPVYEYIERHLSEPITVADLAAQVHLSEARFYVVFKEKLRMSPKAWLQKIRLERAAHLLLSEDFGLEQIAQECGFANAFHLSRLFKKWTGTAPSTWRKQHQGRTL